MSGISKYEMTERDVCMQDLFVLGVCVQDVSVPDV